ncbi:MAG: efflux RND transporter periplasmic adaptor subunit [Planctomycetes bacterium]|nr:efflux RND transporter periplasmic adaptor subunit [Planctomycetota bacterium]
MAIDLETLRLDLPEEDFGKPEGVSSFWRGLALLAIAACGALGYLYVARPLDSSGPQGISVRVQAAAYPTEAELTAFSGGGWIEPAFPYPVIVSAQVEGVLASLEVMEGRDVEEGDTIGNLITQPLEDDVALAEAAVARARVAVTVAKLAPRPEEVELARAAVAKARADHALVQAGFRAEEIAAAQARVQEAEAEEATMKSIADRSALLANEGRANPAQAEKDAGEWKSAQARTVAARHELALKQAGPRPEELARAAAVVAQAEKELALREAGARPEVVAEAEAALKLAQAGLERAEHRLELADIKAPTWGRVLEIKARPGSRLTADHAAAVTLYDPAEMQVRVDVRQEQAALLNVGQRCIVKLEARKGRPFEGELIRIDPLANLARDTVRAKVKILEPDDSLRPDMTCTVDFLPPEAPKAGDQKTLVVPRAAVLSRKGKDYVFVVAEGRATLTTVTLGKPVGANVEVSAGLAAGDLVAVSAIEQLADGAAVVVEGAPAPGKGDQP